MAKETKSTPKPSGLKIARDGYKFSFSWKLPGKADYTSLKLVMQVQKFKADHKTTYWDTYHTEKLKNKATGWSIKLKPKNWYPTRYKKNGKWKTRPRVTGVRFKLIQINKDTKKINYVKSETGWKVFDIKIPDPPSLSQSLVTYNKSQFSWSSNPSATAKKWFKATEIQTCYLKTSPKLSKIKKKFKLKWWAKAKSGKVSFTEDSDDLRIKASGKKYSYSRWVAARSKGPAGASSWVYKRHIYAKPNQPTIYGYNNAKNTLAGGKGTWVKNNSRSGLNVNVRWKLAVTYNHPAEKVEVQYCITTPLNHKMTFPPGSSWTTPPNGNITDTGGLDGCSFTIDTRVKDDECFYVRVVAYHDNIPSESEPVRLNVNGKKPTLSKPSGLTITDMDMVTYRAVVSANNNSGVSGSYLAVKCKKNTDAEQIIGYIPAGRSSAIIQFPKFDSVKDTISVSVYAVAGTDPVVKKEYSTYKTYEIKTVYAFSNTLTVNGNIPVPPSDFNVVKHETVNTSVVATWKWSWAAATEIEFSYSKNIDAWESTDEPQSYIVSQTNAARWIIAGLEEGVTWYFRARFISTIEGESTVGPWTEIKDESLSSVPSKPYMTITPTAISVDESFVASWTYTSNDTTNQALAEVRLVEYVNGTVTKYTDISKSITGTTQKMSIAASEFQMTEGNTYYMCLKVTSASGELSEWSEPVPIAIAQKPTVQISQHSLVEIQTPVEDSIDENYLIETVGYTEEYTLESNSSTLTVENSISSITEITAQIKHIFDETININHVEKFALEPGDVEIDPKHDIYSVTSIISYAALNELDEYDSTATYYVIDVDTMEYVVDPDITAENFDEKRDLLYLRNTISSDDYEFTKDHITLSSNVLRNVTYIVSYAEYLDRLTLDADIAQLLEVKVNGIDVEVTYESSAVIFSSNLSQGDVVRVVYNVTDMETVDPSTYSYSNKTITFTQSYNVGDRFIVSYKNLERDTIVVSNNIDSIELIMAGDTEIRDYTFSGDTITLSNPLTQDTELEISYIPALFDTTLGLKVMPFTADITTNVENPSVRYMITRNENYSLDRPDESQFNGYEDEIIANYTPQIGTAMEIGVTDLMYNFDDGSEYKLTAYVTDSVGQMESDDVIFTVQWDHQATKPEGQFEIYNDEGITVITPLAPAGVDTTGDHCDIYRLSVDKPELIVANAEFGTQYVDPYPTIGEFGGHRIVYVTSNGDYITEEKEIAYIDLDYEDGNVFNSEYQLIDFGSDRAEFLYNVDLSSAWKKDFTETKYLGGHIQGDWNPGVTRTGSISTVSVITMDQELIKAMRRLAVYSGVCHVRTRDGSSYAANVDVSENMQYQSYELATYSMNITRVDGEKLDGMTLAEWRELHPIEPVEQED